MFETKNQRNTSGTIRTQALFHYEDELILFNDTAMKEKSILLIFARWPLFFQVVNWFTFN